MTLQTDPEPTTTRECGSQLPPGGSQFPPDGRDRADSGTVAQQAIDVLGAEDIVGAVALMRNLLPADHGILLKRSSRSERRQLLALLTMDELSDILDEAPTESAVTITRELAPGDAADALDEIDTHTIADVLQELTDEQASAIVAELERPQDVAPLLQYPPDSAAGIMTPDFPRVHYDDTAAIALDALRLFGEDAEGFG
jgi:magnesium transporter